MAKFVQNNLTFRNNQKILMGNSSQAEITFDGSDLVLMASGDLALQGNQVNIGVDDSVNGLVNVYGDSGTVGGQINIHNAANDDGDEAYFVFRANNEHLNIGPVSNPDSLSYLVGQDSWYFTGGTLNLGVQDTQRGNLNIYSGSSGVLGGSIQIDLAPDYDSSIQYFEIRAYEDDLRIGPNTGTDRILYDAGSFAWTIGDVAANRGYITVDKFADSLYVYGGGNQVARLSHNVCELTPDPGVTELRVSPSGPEIEGVVGGTNPVMRLQTSLATFTVNTDILGTLNVGVDDTTRGILSLYGGDGVEPGGDIRMYLSADYDDTISYYRMFVNESNFFFGPDTDTNVFYYQGGDGHIEFNNGWWRFAGDTGATPADFYIGKGDSQYGRLTLYGGVTTTDNGGELRLHCGDDWDVPIDHYIVKVTEDDFTIGPDTDDDALKYIGATNGWEISHDGQLVLSTDTTGIVVVGSVRANDLIVDGNTIYLGDNTEMTEISGGGLEVNGPGDFQSMAIGSAASPLAVASLYVNENFNTSAGTYGLFLSTENEANFNIPFTATAGLGVSVQQNVSTLQNLVQGANISVNIAADNAVATEVTAVKGTAFVTADNTTITDMIGADFKVSPATSMSNAVVGSMIGGRFQILGAGSGDVDVTNGFGILVQTPSFNSSGVTDKLYGLYIQDQSTVGFTTDYNLYSAGASANNMFEGSVEIGGSLRVTGDLILDSTSALTASEVQYNNITPSTYNTVQDGMDTLGSAGLISGGVITADGTANVNVSAGTGMLRTSNDQFAPIEFIDFASATSLAIPDDETKNIVVYYNSGSPEIQVIDVGTGNIHEYFILGQVGRAGDELFISNLRQRISNFSIRSLARLNGTEAVARDGNSGLIIGESADTNRYVTMTAGDVWTLLDLESISAFNSGTGDEFTTVYRDFPTGYVETPGETQWPADDYDDGTGTLASLSNNRFGVRWFWYIPSSADMVMVYGTGNWKSLAEAEAEPVPTEVPGIITEYGVLIGKIIAQKNVTIAAEVSSAFAETYNFSAATTHGNLSNLAAPYDDHTQYSHIDGRRDFTGTVGGIDPVSSTDFVTLGYMATLGTGTQRISYDSTTGDLDISLEHITDVKYTDFDITEDAPPWQEGRVFWDKDNNTFGVYNDVADVTLQVGQETHVKIRNESGVLIPNGSLCYVAGSSQERALVELADASDQDKTEGLLMVTHDLAHNTDGYGTIIGVVRGVDTIGYSDGEEVYLSETTPGAFRLGRPTAPNYVVDVGFIITGDSTANGSILVSFINHGDFATLADVNIPTPPTSGQTLVYDEDNMYWSPETQAKVISYTLPLTGVVDTVVPLTGSFVTKATGVTGDDATDYTISNQHVWLLVNSITGSGYITITGTSLSESTAVPVSADTETIYVSDATSAGVYYQTSKKWWEITNIDIPAGVSAINYDHGALGYPDMGNRNFKIVGYRMDAFASGNTPDMRLIISKVHDAGENVVELVDLEDIGVDSGAAGDQIIDHVRTGGSDRSYTTSGVDVWLNNETFTFKQLDFDTYWSNDENEILAADGNSGFFIRIEGEPDGITNVDYVNLLLYYALL